jgi:uncharacterized protein
LMETITIFAIMAIGGLTQGATGFGFGLVSLVLLSLVMDVKDASIMLAIAGFAINASIFLRLKKYFKKERMMPAVVGGVIGAPLGVCFLLNTNQELIRRTLGVVLILVVIQRLVPYLAKKRWHPFYIGIPCGLFSGALSGAFGTGGPPAVAYTASQDLERHRYVVSIQAILGVGAISRIISLGIGGALTEKVIIDSIAGGVFAIIGAAIGVSILKRLSKELLKKLITGLLLVLAFKYIFF